MKGPVAAIYYMVQNLVILGFDKLIGEGIHGGVVLSTQWHANNAWLSAFRVQSVKAHTTRMWPWERPAQWQSFITDKGVLVNHSMKYMYHICVSIQHPVIM